MKNSTISRLSTPKSSTGEWRGVTRSRAIPNSSEATSQTRCSISARDMCAVCTMAISVHPRITRFKSLRKALGQARAVVAEVEDDHVLAGRQYLRRLPAETHDP